MLVIFLNKFFIIFCITLFCGTCIKQSNTGLTVSVFKAFLKYIFYDLSSDSVKSNHYSTVDIFLSSHFI